MSQRAHGIGVVFGTDFAGVRFVEAALMDAERTKDGLVEVDPRTYEGKKDLFDDAKRPSRSGRPRVLVVSSRTQWRPDWILEAERLGRVRKGEVRIIFVGDPLHASAWSEDTAVLKRIRPLVKLVKLRPTTEPSVRLDRFGQANVAGGTGAIPAIGYPARSHLLLRELAQYADGSVITYRDFQHLCTSDGRKIAPSVLAVYCDVLGIISFSPDQSGNRGLHKVDLNPLVHAALLRSE